MTKANPWLRHWRDRWHAANCIQRRASQSAFYGLGIYVAMFVALVIAAVSVGNTLNFTEQNIVFVSRQPIFLPVLINTIIISIYLAMVSTLNVSSERDQGTLETLIQGPVDGFAFLLGNFLGQLKVYAALALVAFVWSNLLTWLLHLQYSIGVAVVLVVSIAAAAVVIAFGMFIAMWGGRSRTALIYFTLITLLVVGIQLADQIVTGVVLASNPAVNDPLITVRNVLAAANGIVRWVSPYAQLDLAMTAYVDRAFLDFFAHTGIMLLQAAVFLLGSVWLLERKGVRD
ncbi:MAG TPA: ABC transporter permease subunit [Anaerolineales bacterium]|nr:ABC transporter permease subunit [Anaerolineales bacterium]